MLRKFSTIKMMMIIYRSLKLIALNSKYPTSNYLMYETKNESFLSLKKKMKSAIF